MFVLIITWTYDSVICVLMMFYIYHICGNECCSPLYDARSVGIMEFNYDSMGYQS